MKQRELVILGGSGHAKVVVATAIAAGFSVVRILDDNPALVGSDILGIPVVGGCDELSPGTAAVIAIGANHIRKKIATRIDAKWQTIVHPTATIGPGVQLGDGTVVFAGVIIQPDTVIAKHCIINTGATVDHDCALADYVHLGPGSHLAGSVMAREGAFIGLGAGAIPGRTIGAWATVGAGGMVINDVADGATVGGVPARPLGSKTLPPKTAVLSTPGQSQNDRIRNDTGPPKSDHANDHTKRSSS